MSEAGPEPGSVYTDTDRHRWVVEPPKNRERGPFERDRARVLHSFALRRLAAKTQVVRPGSSDFPRTRLTHSLECAQIGRELGRVLGCDPDLVEAACLAHDLGHPPFGHNGEAVLDAMAAPCGGFEGNAQSLRLLTRLECKVLDEAGESAGLNLTRATLDATVKYPWPRRGDSAKFNVYADDQPVFDWIRDGAESTRRCVEAQVMDWSDDVAYSVHDLEDGLYAGLVPMGALRDPVERARVAEVAAREYAHDLVADPAELEEVFADLMGEDCWPEEFDGGVRSLAALKDLTSGLIGRFCRAAQAATQRRYGRTPLARYGAELVVPRRELLECALLKAVARCYVMGRDGASAHREREREVMYELVTELRRGAPATLEPTFRDAFLRARSEGDALRAVIDQAASFTDTSALARHRDLLGGAPRS
ncbi:deoxyguanosinetriphosphate triphosphohydrolase [Spiractinospora alimapuensis]|uniref:deoxyguanosinetriphosphate triphosphohydrolase n=1 Tax=Spiractinospora alimapuensis TaxID=2820884 RepID=UPI001EEB31D7|nr:deoxyguanosinetriphosphate triphosphohydrolase [Spiractinospora alimapuensis]QVQ54746.1 deoxyguanosinetriphosphate triphosphohydrolase [Spiractinospora alimapuensis]